MFCVIGLHPTVFLQGLPFKHTLASTKPCHTPELKIIIKKLSINFVALHAWLHPVSIHNTPYLINNTAKQRPSSTIALSYCILPDVLHWKPSGPQDRFRDMSEAEIVLSSTPTFIHPSVRAGNGSKVLRRVTENLQCLGCGICHMFFFFVFFYFNVRY